jgi:hypothetical protein
LANVQTVVAELSQFKGTEYQFVGVNGEDEPIALLRSIDEVLVGAGWKRQDNKAMTINIPDVNVTDSSGTFMVPEDIRVGVIISFDWPITTDQELTALNALPFDQKPKQMQIAMRLKDLLNSSIQPQNDKNVPTTFINKGKSSTIIQIVVGQKP